jgi:hypothetical protein
MSRTFISLIAWSWTAVALIGSHKVDAQSDNIYVYGRVIILNPTVDQDSVLVVVADTLNRDTTFLIARAPKFKYECHLAYGSVYKLSFTMPKHFS